MTLRFAMFSMFVLSLFASGPVQGQIPTEIEVGAKIDAYISHAKAIVESPRTVLPAHIGLGSRRGPLPVSHSETANSAIEITRHTLVHHRGETLYVYGAPTVDGHAVRRLVGRATVERGGREVPPDVTVVLDLETIGGAGSINDYYLLTADLSDTLVGDDSGATRIIEIADVLAGHMRVVSRVDAHEIDILVRGDGPGVVDVGCQTSLFCTGLTGGTCRCVWRNQQWVCGRPKSDLSQSCIGWCPG